MDSASYLIYTILVKGAQRFTTFEVYPITLEWEYIGTGIW